MKDFEAFPPHRDRLLARRGGTNRSAGLERLPETSQVVAELEHAQRRHEPQAHSWQLIAGDSAQLLRRRRLDVRLFEHLGPPPLERCQISEVCARTFSRPGAEELGQLTRELGERRAPRRMRTQIILSQGVEGSLAEEKRQLGE